jgi:hypothetical protein
LNQSKIMNVIDSKGLERDRRSSSRNLRKLDCAGKAAQRPTFPHPALGSKVGAKAGSLLRHIPAAFDLPGDSQDR